METKDIILKGRLDMAEYKVTVFDKLVLKLQNLKKWFTIKRIVFITVAVALIAVGVVILIRTYTDPEFIVKRAIKNTYSVDKIADSFGIAEDVDIESYIRSFMKTGGNIQAEVSYDYPDEGQYDTFMKTKSLSVFKNNSAKHFELQYADTYNGSFENFNDSDKHCTMVFDSENGKSYKEFDSFNLIADDEYTYYSFDDLDAWFRFENENVVRNYNKSIYTKWLGPIEDGMDFSIDYFNEKPIKFNSVDKDIDDTTGTFDAFCSIIKSLKVDSSRKCKINTSSGERKCNQYTMTIPKNSIRKFLSNYSNIVDDMWNSDDEYTYYNDMYDILSDSYTGLLDWKELSSKVSNDGSLNLYIESGQIIRISVSFFINNNGSFYSVEFQMDNLGDKNVLDKVNCDIVLDEGGMKTVCNISKDKKTKESKTTDLISYYCVTDYESRKEETNKDIKIVYDKENGLFTYEITGKYSNADASQVHDDNTTWENECEKRIKGDGTVSKENTSLEISIDNCNVYYLNMSQNDYMENQNTEQEYNMNGTFRIDTSTNNAETTPITKYTDAFSMSEREYEKTLEENLPKEPGHGLRRILYVIYEKRDRENVEKLISNPAYDRFNTLGFGNTNGFNNEQLLQMYNIGFGETNIRWPYAEDSVPQFIYTNRKAFNQVEMTAYNQMMRNYVLSVNQDLVENGSGIRLYNIGFYKNMLNNLKSDNKKNDDSYYIYLKPTTWLNYTNDFETLSYEVEVYFCQGQYDDTTNEHVCIGSKRDDIY